MSYLSLLEQYPLHTARTEGWQLDYRSTGEAGAVTHVLLHGIGSASANWVMQLQAAHASADLRVLAWDAPGYGNSTALAAEKPLAVDYAKRLWHWLDLIGVTQPVVLVGHSLGALMGSAAAALRPYAVRELVLLAPARGYASVSEAEREKVRGGRINNLREFGPAGMAERRSAAMLSPTATSEQISFVRASMEKINPAGYEQAVHLLADSDLVVLLAMPQPPIRVASGTQDGVTRDEACRALAVAAGVHWEDLGPVGHACALEGAPAVNQLLGLSASALANNGELA